MGDMQLVWWYDHLYVTGTRFSLGQTTYLLCSRNTRARLYYWGVSDNSPQRLNLGLAPAHKHARSYLLSLFSRSSSLS